jgi:hypothetical protein
MLRNRAVTRAGAKLMGIKIGISLLMICYRIIFSSTQNNIHYHSGLDLMSMDLKGAKEKLKGRCWI